MCFVAYIGTEKPLPRKSWDKNAPDLSVESLTDRDSPIRFHFTKPEVQYVGSTSACGCDFPHISLQNGEWPNFEDDEDDPELTLKDRSNREKLVALLRQTGENVIEFYGVWDGDFAEKPKARETISLELILDDRFMFKEQGFYQIEMTRAQL
jgi:hypothetical protein